MTSMKTPGVYVVEKDALPNSIVAAETAVPVFIGYTQKAANGDKSLLNKAWRISSMQEFKTYFGDAPKAQFELLESVTKTNISFNGRNYVAKAKDKYSLYYNMMLFYANGGDTCFIYSVGDYSSAIDGESFMKAMDGLLKEQEPTMVVIPEAVCLSKSACYAVQQAMLKHCGCDMRNRVALLDVFDGYKDHYDEDGDVVNDFREGIVSDYLSFGAAYYPWINCSVVHDEELDFKNLDIAQLKELLTEELTLVQLPEEKKQQLATCIESINADLPYTECRTLDKTLFQLSKLYPEIMRAMQLALNLLPPSATMAGVITSVDKTKGVWKVPANAIFNDVISPAFNISHYVQEDLMVPIFGKSINAILPFLHESVTVSGGRTMDGNTLDWRYINFRRTIIMLEESVKNGLRAVVFQPNDAETWKAIKSTITNFLDGIWKRGGLAGSVPTDAFEVYVGLGETMTPQDVLDGVMKVKVFVAVVRPTEFIEISFQQQMQ